MNALSRFCLFLVVSLFLPINSYAQFSCIAGRVPYGKVGDEVSVYFYSDAYAVALGQDYVVRTTLNDELEFKLKWTQAGCVSVGMYIGEDNQFYNVQFCDDDSVYIEFEEPWLISGKSKEQLVFFLDWSDFLSDYYRNAPPFLSMTPEEYFEHIEYRLEEGRKFYSQNMEDAGSSPKLAAAFENEEIYQYATYVAQYAWRNPKSTLNVYTSETYQQVLDEVRFSNPEALGSGRYIHFLREWPYGVWYYNYSHADSSKQSRIDHFEFRDSVAQHYFEGEAYDLALFHIIIDKIENLEARKGKESYGAYLEETKSFIEQKMKDVNNELLHSKVEQLMNEQLREPDLAPDFSAVNSKGEVVHLSELRGKVVYIDFWATNCAPCVAEIPASLALQEKFAGDDVVFLYVALQADVEGVKTFILQNNFSGLHWFVPDAFHSDVAVEHQISSIPRYMIIDKHGRLITDNALRPSANPEAILRQTLSQ